MKSNFLILLSVLALAFSSCERDDTSNITININNGGDNGSGDVNLSGIYTEDLTLVNGTNYVITGPVLMSEGTTFTIPEGMTVKVQPVGVNAYIAIQQGARIIANGSATNPIVFTSNATSPDAGDWGGLILCGKAPINSTVQGSEETSTTEVGGLQYGGNIENDDSGILNYVRIEYSGGAIDGSSELNGLSLYAVGNETQINYVQIFEASDDGVEFFGGNVDVNFVSVINSQDDSIDWTEGYVGSITEVYVQHGSNHDKAFECDGYNTDFSNAGGYFSKPTVTNVTVTGDEVDSGNEAFRLRAGTQGLFSNINIIDFEEAFDLDGDTGSNPTGQGVVEGNLNVMGVSFTNVSTQVNNGTGVSFTDEEFLSGIGNATGTDYSTWGAGWTKN